MLSRLARALILIMALAPWLGLPRAAAATHIDLNDDWQFCLDPAKRGEQLGWTAQLPAESETVRVPHTWNIGQHDDYEGTAWYFKGFTLPDELRGKHIEIHFGATFYKSRVWLNGVLLGGHEGGHTAYYFDVTPHLARVRVEWSFGPARRPVGFRASITRRRPDEMPSYALRNYRLEWELRDNDNTKLAGGEKLLGEIGPPQSVEASWAQAASKSLRLRVIRPTGFVAAEKVLDWWEARPGGFDIDVMKQEGVAPAEVN